MGAAACKVHAMLAAASNTSQVALNTVIAQEDAYSRFAPDLALSNRGRCLLDAAVNWSAPSASGCPAAASMWYLKLPRFIRRSLNNDVDEFVGGVCPAHAGTTPARIVVNERTGWRRHMGSLWPHPACPHACCKAYAADTVVRTEATCPCHHRCALVVS